VPVVVIIEFDVESDTSVIESLLESGGLLRYVKMDAVLGAQTKWSEMYYIYIERHFVQSNNEMRHLRISFIE
jgi:hypothetical protein